MKIVDSTKKFVNDHKFGLGVAVGFIPAFALVVRNQAITNHFLKEHDLFEEYYKLEEI